MAYSNSSATWSISTNGNQMFNLSQLDIKIASVLAELFLNNKDGMSQFFFYNHDFYQVPDGKVLRIRLDIVNQSKLFKKKKND